jgi:hypothetical protein
MKIDESDEHCQNADSAIDERREPESNVTVERDLQSQKQSLAIFATEEGMQIDVVISGCRPLGPSRRRSRTSTRTPPTETKFRGKKLPEERE